ncbi:hypothetical protein D3OALGA1CA_5182 [Olavius algarvensis associated proteobacterium Delta 3]|nr:hypothetical protein D3OALGA1CA_5182 [Olavius algarvensis associated proteobacterium Delta 3]
MRNRIPVELTWEKAFAMAPRQELPPMTTCPSQLRSGVG